MYCRAFGKERMGSVIYLAALSGVDTQLHEAATIDGASRLQRVWYINIPTIMPTMVILLIMSFGSLMSVGFENHLDAESFEYAILECDCDLCLPARTVRCAVQFCCGSRPI